MSILPNKGPSECAAFSETPKTLTQSPQETKGCDEYPSPSEQQPSNKDNTNAEQPKKQDNAQAQEDDTLSAPVKKVAKISTKEDANISATDKGSNCGSLENKKISEATVQENKPQNEGGNTTKQGKAPRARRKTKDGEGKQPRKAARVKKEKPEVEKPSKRKNSIYQGNLLEKVFELNSNPNHEIKKAISESAGLPLRQVQIWFQNRRAKLRRDIASLIENESPEYINTLLEIPDSIPVPQCALSDQAAPQRWSREPTKEEELFLSLVKKPQQESSKKKKEISHATEVNRFFVYDTKVPPFLSLLSPLPPQSYLNSELHTMAEESITTGIREVSKEEKIRDVMSISNLINEKEDQGNGGCARLSDN